MNSKEFFERCRQDFPSLSMQRNGGPPIYLDNACTTLVPRQVIASMEEYYERFPACGGGRSHHWFAEEVNSRIDGDAEKAIKGSRGTIANFINAKSEKEIIFTLNTTHAINIVALGMRFRTGDIVLLSDKEHNSNLVPWLRLHQKGLIKVEHTAANEVGFDLEGFERKLRQGGVALVSMAFTSNTTGYTIPACEIIRIAHQNGARVLLDGAQTVPHKSVDVEMLDVDFLAFSMHKMCGPRGMGVLYCKREVLNQGVIEQCILGGGTVSNITNESYELMAAPESFEAGNQNYPGQIASGAAVEYLRQIGIDRIAAHESQLNCFLSKELMSRYGDTGLLRIVGSPDAVQRGGILTFEVKAPNATGIVERLSEKANIMVRDGVFCAHSYFNDRFGQGWTRQRSHSEHRMVYRVSFYFYNTINECRLFIEALDQIFRERGYID